MITIYTTRRVQFMTKPAMVTVPRLCRDGSIYVGWIHCFLSVVVSWQSWQATTKIFSEHY